MAFPAKKKCTQNSLQNEIFQLLLKSPGTAQTLGALMKKLKFSNSKDSYKAAIQKLLDQKQIKIQGKKGYFVDCDNAQSRSRLRSKEITGPVSMISSGSAYLLNNDGEDVFISSRSLNGALDRDIVRVQYEISKRGKRKGKVIEILQRFRSGFIGRFQEYKNFGYVYVEGIKGSPEIKILPNDYLNARSGDMVELKIISWNKHKTGDILGKVVRVFLATEEIDLQMNQILLEFGFDQNFPKEAMEESQILEETIQYKETKDRRDYRNIFTITIDPIDARDFDDALSLRILPSGNVEVGIHIADVGFYVKEGSALDKEAFRRATSVYLVDRVCPMLPEKISNELCSLRPREDKFCFSAVFEFDKHYQLVDQWFGKTVIHSNHRFNYEDVQTTLDTGAGKYAEELRLLNKIAEELNNKRFKEGSINFETEEVRFQLGPDGSPETINKKERVQSHKLVEEFMLLANKKVAEKVQSYKPVPSFVYRVHDLPDPEKLAELNLFATAFGIKLRLDSPRNIVTSLNHLGNLEKTNPAGYKLIMNMAIRSMAKAVYTTKNIGHYGLGFKYYTHFTSPIRRYSDILSHRILYALLTGRKQQFAELEEKCKNISSRERDAIQAERESTKYFQLLYLKKTLRESYSGILKNITEKGIFVELSEIFIDGYISLSSQSIPLLVRPGGMKVYNTKNQREWNIGDQIAVKIRSIDMERRMLDLDILVDS